jgi:hypothetical protein
VFDDTSLPVVHITINPAQLDDLFLPGNQYSDEEKPATFAFKRGLDSVTVDSVGFRFRGNTSRDAAKKSFKVSFNTFRRGQKFFGLEKLNLNGEHNDPSIVRSKIGWDLFRSVGVPSSRANHVRLYINGEYFGLYVNVEHVDEQFLQREFGSDAGNLYKCLWPADLAWLGSDPELYRQSGADRSPYDLRLKDDQFEGYDDLVHLIDVLNHSSAADFPSAIEEVFNVNGFLRALAVTALTGSWDSYWFLKNNYYLYSNPDTGLFEYVPYDFDNIMGIWWEGIYPGLDWTTRNVYAWGHPDAGEVRPLADRILSVPEFRSRYTLYLRRLLSGSFETGPLQSRILALRSLVEDAAVDDLYRTFDYGYSVDQFNDSFFGALGGHVVDGLLPFVSERARTAAAQLDTEDVVPLVSDLIASPSSSRPGAVVTISVRVEDEDATPDVRLYHRVGSGVEQEVPMPLRPDLGVDRYAATVTSPEMPATIEYYVVAVDRSGQRVTTETRSIAVLGSVPLLINEIMASNVMTVLDSAGEFDDWIELYNGGSTPFNVSGFTLSDDRNRPDKWSLPDTSIAPGGYLIVWADEDGTQGPLHANFRLATSGEYVGLYDPAGVPLDTLTFSAQQQDVAFGRTPDGSDTWAFLASATPGRSNSGAVATERTGQISSRDLIVYPNPFVSHVRVTASGEVGGIFEIFDLLGRKLASYESGPGAAAEFRWDGIAADGSGVPSGIYFIRYSGLSGLVMTRSIVRLH